MSEKWVDERITTRSSRTPEQRRADAREAEVYTVDLSGTGHAILERRIAEQNIIIAKQNERLDMLHDLIEQQQTGARGQARRIDLVHDTATAVEANLERLQCNTQSRLNRLDQVRDNAHTLLNQRCAQAKRVRKQFPSVGEPTTQETEEEIDGS